MPTPDEAPRGGRSTHEARRAGEEAPAGRGLALALDARRGVQAPEEVPLAGETGKLTKSVTPGPPSAVELRAAGLAGTGLSFFEHCRRLRDGNAEGLEDPTQLLPAGAKQQTKSMQLSHLLLGHERKTDRSRCAGGDGEHEAEVAALWPHSGFRPSTSSAAVRRSAPPLPIGGAAQRPGPGREEASAPAGASPEALAPPRPPARRWPDAGLRQPSAAGASEGGTSPSSCAQVRGPGGLLQRPRSSSSSQVGSLSSPGDGRRMSPHRSLPTSATQPRLDRCCMRACAGMTTGRA